MSYTMNNKVSKRRVGWSCFLGKNSVIKVKVRQGPWLGGRGIQL